MNANFNPIIGLILTVLMLIKFFVHIDFNPIIGLILTSLAFASSSSILHFNPIIGLILTLHSLFLFEHHDFNPIIGLILTIQYNVHIYVQRFQSHYRSDFNNHHYDNPIAYYNFNPIIGLILTIKEMYNREQKAYFNPIIGLILTMYDYLHFLITDISIPLQV